VDDSANFFAFPAMYVSFPINEKTNLTSALLDVERKLLEEHWLFQTLASTFLYVREGGSALRGRGVPTQPKPDYK
jgi:hypothetical protein